MVHLTDATINEQSIIDQVRSPRVGAVVVFLGMTRELTVERRTESLDYEAYRPMAEKRIAELESEARRRWPIIECAIVHRTGNVPASETSVAIAVGTPHRRDAFEAGRWLIDRIKESVPIWKREQYADGATDWVHPDSTS